MITGFRKARQPTREVWSRERLVHEQAIALGNVIDRSTLSNYSSALNSYLNFVKLHGLPVDPTPETLSFYTVYMCHHVNPRSVNTYLSGISQQLETHFPAVKEARNSTVVRRTLQGCMRMRGTATVRKRALTINDLQLVINHYHDTTTHDDLLFLAMLLTGFFGLLRLGELVFPDEVSLQNWKKVTRRNTVSVQNDRYEFTLLGHKADRFFEGNRIIIPALRFTLSPLRHFSRYINSRDASCIPSLAYRSRICTHSLLLYHTASHFLQQRRCRSLHASRWCHFFGRTWRVPIHHSSIRTLGVRHFPSLHPKEPHPSSRLPPYHFGHLFFNPAPLTRFSSSLVFISCSFSSLLSHLFFFSFSQTSSYRRFP